MSNTHPLIKYFLLNEYNAIFSILRKFWRRNKSKNFESITLCDSRNFHTKILYQCFKIIVILYCKLQSLYHIALFSVLKVIYFQIIGNKSFSFGKSVKDNQKLFLGFPRHNLTAIKMLCINLLLTIVTSLLDKADIEYY